MQAEANVRNPSETPNFQSSGGSADHPLIGNGDAKVVKLGINKMQVETNQGEIYMNRKHMVAESEVNKRQDFTINGNKVGD